MGLNRETENGQLGGLFLFTKYLNTIFVFGMVDLGK